MVGWVMISAATRPDVSLALSIGWMVAPGWRGMFMSKEGLVLR